MWVIWPCAVNLTSLCICIAFLNFGPYSIRSWSYRPAAFTRHETPDAALSNWKVLALRQSSGTAPAHVRSLSPLLCQESTFSIRQGPDGQKSKEKQQFFHTLTFAQKLRELVLRWWHVECAESNVLHLSRLHGEYCKSEIPTTIFMCWITTSMLNVLGQIDRDPQSRGVHLKRNGNHYNYNRRN